MVGSRFFATASFVGLLRMTAKATLVNYINLNSVDCTLKLKSFNYPFNDG